MTSHLSLFSVTKIWRITFVTFLGRMWRSRTRQFVFNLWRFLSHPLRKTSHFGPAGTKKIWTGRNVKFSVSVKKIKEGWTGGASDIVKAESSGENPRATGGLDPNLPHPRVNKTKQHTQNTWWIFKAMTNSMHMIIDPFKSIFKNRKNRNRFNRFKSI